MYAPRASGSRTQSCAKNVSSESCAIAARIPSSFARPSSARAARAATGHLDELVARTEAAQPRRSVELVEREGELAHGAVNGLGALVHQAGASQLGRGREAGHPGADDDHVCVHQ